MSFRLAFDRRKRQIPAVAKLAPSVLAADFSRLAEEIADTDRIGADMLHLDIMDGHFVPNISFGPGIVGTINQLTDNFLDVHLMLSEPHKYFEPFVDAGADNITFHIEVHPDPTPYICQLREMKCRAGLSLNPDTPVDTVLPFMSQVDFLLIMSVFPGFGGQTFIESTLPKIAAARSFIDAHGLTTQIQVDGGVDSGNAERIVQAGADVLIMGTAFFGAKDRTLLVRKVHGLKRPGLST
ncbi:MAG TPA: ribulose-phosphate 3-epimerase [Candidatus Deferrimicrobium sp.]|nr:ribulose-phosphate 3-epimerase [Candidatus Deferrimicrobium sp.]